MAQTFSVGVNLTLNDEASSAFKRFLETVAPASKIGSEISASFRNVGKELQNTVKSFGKFYLSLKGQFASLAGQSSAVFAFAKHQADIGDALATQAQKIGITTDAWSAMTFAAEKLDVSTGDLEQGLIKLSRNMYLAANGNKSLAAGFADIGVEIVDANGNLRSANEVFVELADRFEDTENGTKAAAVAMELFGRSGANLLPMLKSGSAAIQEQMTLADKLGKVWTDEAGAAANDFNNQLIDLYAAFDGIRNVIAQHLFPILGDAAKVLRGAIVDVLAEFKKGTYSQEIEQFGKSIHDFIVELPDKIRSLIGIVRSAVGIFGGFGATIKAVAGAFLMFRFGQLIVSVYQLCGAFGALWVSLHKSTLFVSAEKHVITFVGTLKNKLVEGVKIAGHVCVQFSSELKANLTMIWKNGSAWVRDFAGSLKTTLAGALSKAGAGLASFGAALKGAFVSGATAAMGALKALWAAMLANPITAIIAAVAALGAAVYLIYDNWDTVGPWLAEKWERIKDIFWGSLDAVISCVTEKIDRVKAAFSEGFLHGIYQVFREFSPIGLLTDAFKEIYDYVSGISLYDAGLNIINSLLNGLKNAFGDVTSWVGGAVGTITDTFGSAARWFGFGGGEQPAAAATENTRETGEVHRYSMPVPAVELAPAMPRAADVLQAARPEMAAADAEQTFSPIDIFIHTEAGEQVEVRNANRNVNVQWDNRRAGRRVAVGAGAF